MSPAVAPKEGISAEWVKWVAGIAIVLSGSVFGYAISIERRLSTTETAQANHIKTADEAKADVYRRLDRQDDNISKVLNGITAVQVEVAKISGYMERQKATH